MKHTYIHTCLAFVLTASLVLPGAGRSTAVAADPDTEEFIEDSEEEALLSPPAKGIFTTHNMSIALGVVSVVAGAVWVWKQVWGETVKIEPAATGELTEEEKSRLAQRRRTTSDVATPEQQQGGGKLAASWINRAAANPEQRATILEQGTRHLIDQGNRLSAPSNMGYREAAKVLMRMQPGKVSTYKADIYWLQNFEVAEATPPPGDADVQSREAVMAAP